MPVGGGTEGQGAGQFNHPYFAAVDDSGNVYVADYDNNRIQKFVNPATPTLPATWGSDIAAQMLGGKADDYDLETRTLAKYFLEVTIMDERFLGSPPSFTAAGAHCLARMMLKKGNWVCTLDDFPNTKLLTLARLLITCITPSTRTLNSTPWSC